jgi:hypothetical protein
MTAFGDDWQIGQILSEDEIERLESETGLHEVISVATHPAPGVHFTDPYQGTYLQLNAASQAFASEPDSEDSEDNPNQVIYLGEAKSDEELIRTAADFITGGDHEIAAAIYFHFTSDAFGQEDWFWQALPEFYWCRLGSKFERFSSHLDETMKSISPLYDYVAKFFVTPDAAEYSAFREIIAKENGFSHAFELFKYADTYD